MSGLARTFISRPERVGMIVVWLILGGLGGSLGAGHGVMALGRFLVWIPDEPLAPLRARAFRSSREARPAISSRPAVRRALALNDRLGRPVNFHLLEREQRVARPLAEVFEFFARASSLERITPPWLSFRLAGEQLSELQPGTLLEYRLRVHGMPLRWVSQIELWEPGHSGATDTSSPRSGKTRSCAVGCTTRCPPAGSGSSPMRCSSAVTSSRSSTSATKR
jgi:hypothetical protein